MSNLMAAIGRVQLQRLESEFKPRRMALTRLYRDELRDVKGIVFFETQGEGIVSHILPIRVLDGKKERVRDALHKEGIQFGLHYQPNHLLTKYRRQNVRLPVVERLVEEMITLPLHPELSDSDVRAICRIVGGAV
jgi:dTDP-4-amino-4,6-dideoxygalactose transaminase